MKENKSATTPADAGGPAFPRNILDHSHGLTWAVHESGMTLRDYFAAKAMQTYWSDGSVSEELGGDTSADLDRIAQFAYAQADAMLKARQA